MEYGEDRALVLGPQRMIICGPIRPDVDPELARIDPLAASEWFGWVPDVRERASVLAASLRGRGLEQLAEIIETVEGDPGWGWLALDSRLLLALAEQPRDANVAVQVDQWLRLKGVRVVDFAGVADD